MEAFILGTLVAILYAIVNVADILKEIRDELRDNRHGRS
jgi:hypothetical protein